MDEEKKEEQKNRVVELLEELLEETKSNNLRSEKYSYFTAGFAIVAIIASVVAVSFSIQADSDNWVEKIIVPLILLGVVFVLFYVVFRDVPWKGKD